MPNGDRPIDAPLPGRIKTPVRGAAAGSLPIGHNRAMVLSLKVLKFDRFWHPAGNKPENLEICATPQKNDKLRESG